MAKKKSSKPSANHLRAWREKAGLTQDQLAALVGTAGNVIGLLESGERGLSDKWLRKLAPHLGTTPGYLLDHDPDEVDAEFLETVIQASKGRKALVLSVIRALKTGTDG
jgi:transcriptional regulator with XRE-family HTH domain